MEKRSGQPPTERFSGLAELYAAARPSYPQEAIDFIISRCGLRAGSVLADIGCGTGISSRLFAERGVAVIGIEPNADMRARAQNAPQPAHWAAIEYRDGSGEHTGLDSNSVDCVLAAQAFHWLDADLALHEFDRILKPSGWAVLMWNERDQSDPFTAAYGAALRKLHETASVEVPRQKAGDPLLRSELFRHTERNLFANEQVMDEQALINRARSASYVPKQGADLDAFLIDLKAVYEAFARAGTVTLKYETSIYTGQRAER